MGKFYVWHCVLGVYPPSFFPLFMRSVVNFTTFVLSLCAKVKQKYFFIFFYICEFFSEIKFLYI